MLFPFVENPGGASDDELAGRAQHGDSQAVEELVLRHQGWLYNLLVRMVWSPDDAQDLTQDVLLKMIAGLPGFHFESRFRTWLYRIAVNRVFTFKKQHADRPAVSYEEFVSDMAQTPDLDPDDPHHPATRALIEEAQVLCTLAMLQCLDGRQRLVFVLGEVFGISDRVGAEVLDLTPDTFRQILADARCDLYRFMAGQCGLVNPSNPCRCSRKMRGFIQQGFLDPERRQFTTGHRFRMSQLAPCRARELEDAASRLHAEFFRNHPFLDLREQGDILRRVLDRFATQPSGN